jgi:surface polysaccharide O-acyltransferase-like enzyme
LWQRLFAPGQSSQLARYLTGLFFGLYCLVAFFETLSGKTEQIYTFFTCWLGYGGFYLYGGLIRRGWAFKLSPKTWAWLAGASILVAIALDYYWVKSVNVTGQPASVFLAWFYNVGIKISYVLISVSTFEFLRQRRPLFAPWPRLQSWWQNLLRQLAKLSFGVYLFHVVVVNFLASEWVKFTFDDRGGNVWLFCATYYSFVMLVSLFLTWLWQRLPGLRRLIGEG